MIRTFLTCDVCGDRCYNKIDKFIYDLTKTEDTDMRRLHDMLTGGSSD